VLALAERLLPAANQIQTPSNHCKSQLQRIARFRNRKGAHKHSRSTKYARIEADKRGDSAVSGGGHGEVTADGSFAFLIGDFDLAFD